jgi:hypothetical protein
VKVIAAFEALVLLLISAASIVTPLGLYEAIVPLPDLEEVTFSYAEDGTPMGMG